MSQIVNFLHFFEVIESAIKSIGRRLGVFRSEVLCIGILGWKIVKQVLRAHDKGYRVVESVCHLRVKEPPGPGVVVGRQRKSNIRQVFFQLTHPYLRMDDIWIEPVHCGLIPVPSEAEERIVAAK